MKYPLHAGRSLALLTSLLTFLALLFPYQIASAAPLTLSDAQHRAVERSHLVSARTSAIDASRDMAIAAGQLPDPQLKFGVDNLPVNGADRYSVTNDFMTMRRIGVMQEITRSGKRELRSERYQGEVDKGLAEKAMTIANIQRDTALAWFDRYYAEAMQTAIVEQVQESTLEVQAAEAAYRGGHGNQADIFAARGALAAMQDRASEASRRVRNAKTALARWIGETADEPLGAIPVTDTLRLDIASLDTTLIHHPDIAMLNSQVRIADTEAKLAEAKKQADWSVDVSYAQRGSAFSNMVSVGISIPLQWDQKHRQDREVAAKLAMADEARAERDDMLRAHTAEVKAMATEWENNRERSTHYQQEIIPLARQRTEATLAAYRGGKASISDVLSARRNEIDVRLQALHLEMDMTKLWAQINYLFPEGEEYAHHGATAASTTEFTKDAK